MGIVGFVVEAWDEGPFVGDLGHTLPRLYNSLSHLLLEILERSRKLALRRILLEHCLYRLDYASRNHISHGVYPRAFGSRPAEDEEEEEEKDGHEEGRVRPT